MEQNEESLEIENTNKKNNRTFIETMYSKKRNIAAHTLCLGLVFSLSVSPALAVFLEKNSKNNTRSESDYSEEEITTVNEEEVELAVNSLSDIAIESMRYIEEIPDTNSELVSEIQKKMANHNLTNQELISIVTSDEEYRKDLENIVLSHPEITEETLYAVLQGSEIQLKDYLFIGDSRTKGMLLSGVINEDNSIYGIGYGYHWFTGKGKFSSSNTNALEGAIEAVKTKTEENKSTNIIIWLGVNDYTYVDANTYFSKFEELAVNEWANHSIYIVSVGPVKDKRASSVSNKGIDQFNLTLKEMAENASLDNLHYLDLQLSEDSIQNYDSAGLHYGASDYQAIYKRITEKVRVKEEEGIYEMLSLFYEALISYDYAISKEQTKEFILK